MDPVLTPEIAATAEAVQSLTSLLSKLPPGPWEARYNGSQLKWEVHAAEPFLLRQSRYAKGEPKKPRTLVATMAGGASDVARDMAHFIAAARNHCPLLAEVVMRRSGWPESIELPAEPEPGSAFDAATMPSRDGEEWDDSRIADHFFAFHRLLDQIADLVDDFIQACGGGAAGLPLTNRNASALTRLTSGGDDARRLRARILEAVSDTIRPEFDARKLAGLPPQHRVPANGKPKLRDVYNALPAELTGNGQRLYATDEEMRAELTELIAANQDRVQAWLAKRRK